MFLAPPEEQRADGLLGPEPGDGAARLADERAGLAQPEAAEAVRPQDAPEDRDWPWEGAEVGFGVNVGR